MGTDAPTYKQEIEAALAAIASGDVDNAVAQAEGVIQAHGPVPEAVYLLGLIAARMDEPARTLELMRMAHSLAPNIREFADALAIAHAKLGRLGDSLYFGKLAAVLPPHPDIPGLIPNWFGTFEDAFVNISETRYGLIAEDLLALGSIDKALEMYRREAEANAEDADVWRVYADRLIEAGRTVPALLALRKVMETGKSTPRDEARTAGCLGALGRFEDMRALHDGMIEKGWVTPEAFSLMVGDMAADPDNDAAFIAQAERTYAETFPPTDEADIPSRAIETGALKVGIVSSRLSLRDGLDFLWPLFAGATFEQMALFVYANDPIEDTIARRVQGTVSAWLDTREIDDLTLDTIIRNDGIHILIDLDGHRAGGRPELFLRRPAPCALRLCGLVESAAAQGFDAVLGDAAIYPQAAGEDGGEGVIAVEGGLFRLPSYGAVAAGGDVEERAPVLGLSLRQAELTDDVVGALADACARHPDLKLMFSADRLGGAIDEDELAGLLGEAMPADRLLLAPSDTAGAPRLVGRQAAYLQIGPCWPAALSTALLGATPVFAARGRLPHGRMTDSVMQAMGLAGVGLCDTPAEAIAKAAAAAAEPGGGVAGEAARAALATAGEPNFVADWAKALHAALNEAYRRYVAKGAAA